MLTPKLQPLWLFWFVSPSDPLDCRLIWYHCTRTWICKWYLIASTNSASCPPACRTYVLYASCGFITIASDKLWQDEFSLESSSSLSIIWLPFYVIIFFCPCRVYRILVWVYSCRISFMKESGFIVCGFCLVCILNARSLVFCLVAIRCISSMCNYVHWHPQQSP